MLWPVTDSLCACVSKADLSPILRGSCGWGVRHIRVELCDMHFTPHRSHLRSLQRSWCAWDSPSYGDSTLGSLMSLDPSLGSPCCVCVAARVLGLRHVPCWGAIGDPQRPDVSRWCEVGLVQQLRYGSGTGCQLQGCCRATAHPLHMHLRCFDMDVIYLFLNLTNAMGCIRII